MKEYEISNSNNKVIGKVKTFDNKTNFKNTIIESNSGLSYNVKEDDIVQTYEIEYLVDNVDDLFDIVSKYVYEHDKVFESIEEIKEYNNIKIIKKGTKINIIVPEIHLEKLGISKENIDYKSLITSKVYFIKKVLPTLNKENIINDLNNIINEYNNYIQSKEYEFYTDEEKKLKNETYIERLDNIINDLENNTNYKYGKNYVIPIKLKSD